MEIQQKNPPIFVTGIGTGVGKTVISAMLCSILNADYWKPIQCGDLDSSDSMSVKQLVGPQLTVHPERYRLKAPLSPHAAARAENLSVAAADFTLPKTSGPLVIEGAGGLLVPLNNKETIADLILQLRAQVVLVSRHYLGSINHTLLSVAYLKQRQIPLLGIVFNGSELPDSEEVILQHTGARVLFRAPDLTEVSEAAIQTRTKELRDSLNTLIS